MSRLYVYAFAETPVKSFTAAGRRVRSVEIAGVHVVVDRREPDAGASEEALRRQHAIVEALAARTEALLPARFGSLVTADRLERLLETNADAVRAALDTVRARQQMTLRLAAAPAALRTEAPESGAAYLEMKRAAVVQPDPVLLSAVRGAVAGVVRAEQIQPGRADLRPVVYHLVDRGRIAEYRRRIDALLPTVAADSVSLSGPWPPFAFTPELPE